MAGRENRLPHFHLPVSHPFSPHHVFPLFVWWMKFLDAPHVKQRHISDIAMASHVRWVWVKIRYPNNWMVNTKLDISICGPLGLPFWPTSRWQRTTTAWPSKWSMPSEVVPRIQGIPRKTGWRFLPRNRCSAAIGYEIMWSLYVYRAMNINGLNMTKLLVIGFLSAT